MNAQKGVVECLINVGCLIDDVDGVDLTDAIEDSMMFITFIVQLEEHFNITVPDEYLIFDKFNTLDSIVDLVEELSCEGVRQ